MPLETERGYHAMILDARGRAAHAADAARTARCRITWTDRGLRCAGQVEIAGLEAAPNWKRAEILRDHLLRSFPDLPRDLPAERVRFWMGHRPSMPDGLPCLGPAAPAPDVLLAFGHGHVGLVAGAAHGAAAVAHAGRGSDRRSPVGPFDPARFA